MKQRVKLLTRRLVIGLTVGLTVALIGGLTAGLVVGLTIGLTVGLVIGLVIGLAIGLTEWVGIPSRTDWASRPQSTYKATRTLTVLQLCLALLAFGLAGWLTVGLTVSLTAGLVIGLTGGLAARLAGRLVIRSGAWLSYVLAICWFAASGKLPLRLMDFLDDAHRLGLLRTVGPAYQFRHAEFQDHLVRTAGTLTATD